MGVEKSLLLAMTSAASDARERAYAPYSGFRVGAAALGDSGRVYAGCNIENASYGLTICAERVAILRAVAEGEKAIRAVVIVAGETEPSPPCGACLQVMAEFAPADEPLIILTCSATGTCTQSTLVDHLPRPFRL